MTNRSLKLFLRPKHLVRQLQFVTFFNLHGWNLDKYMRVFYDHTTHMFSSLKAIVPLWYNFNVITVNQPS